VIAYIEGITWLEGLEKKVIRGISDLLRELITGHRGFYFELCYWNSS